MTTIPDPRTREGLLQLHEMLKTDGDLMQGLLDAMTGNYMDETGTLGVPLTMNPYFAQSVGLTDQHNIESALLLAIHWLRTGEPLNRVAFKINSTASTVIAKLGAEED